MTIKLVILAVILIVYLTYTSRYSIEFNRSNYFTGRFKAFHIVLIWIIPFVWIILLKGLFKPTPNKPQFLLKDDLVGGRFTYIVIIAAKWRQISIIDRYQRRINLLNFITFDSVKLSPILEVFLVIFAKILMGPGRYGKDSKG